MRFRVRHQFRYRYDAPVALGPYLLRLTPRGAVDMAHGIRVTPEPNYRRDETDHHGNLVTRLGFRGATSALEIEARFELETGKQPERIKVLRSTLAEGSGTPGAIIGDDLTVACGSGAVRLVEIQRAGKGPVRSAEFLRGLRAPLTRLG